MKISSRCCLTFMVATAISSLSNTNAFTPSSFSSFKTIATKAPTDSALFSTLSPVSTTLLGNLQTSGVNAISGADNSTTRRPIVAGNWKLNPTSKTEAIELLNGLKNGSQGEGDVEVVVFPPLPFLSDALSILDGTGIKVGAQTSSTYEKGAYTGEVAPSMLASAGVSYVLLGHSERRTIFGENDSSINERVKLCLAESDLKVVLCIGETLEEYEAGLLNSVVDTQLRKGLAGVSADDLLDGRVILAYEPVWAIGTGLVATPDQAQAAHVAIRNTLSSMYAATPKVSSSMRIQYGGSVSPDSVSDLMKMPDVDGALVGGASLVADSFTKIISGSAPAIPNTFVQAAINGADADSVATPAFQNDLKFSHAPISYFSIDKLQSKGPRKGADVGSPHDSTRPLVGVGGLSSGSWWCAAGGWPSPNQRATTEIFYVLEGHACVTDLDGTRNFFGPGDLVILPKGWSGRWDVMEDIHKVWVVTDHPDIGNGEHAIIKPYSSFAPHHLSPDGVRNDASHGAPMTASATYLDNGYVSVGSWTCSPGSFPVSELPATEAFHLLEGVAFITNTDGSARRLVAGDTVILPKGWSGQWDVIEPIKKVWVVSYL